MDGITRQLAPVAYLKMDPGDRRRYECQLRDDRRVTYSPIGYGEDWPETEAILATVERIYGSPVVTWREVGPWNRLDG